MSILNDRAIFEALEKGIFSIDPLIAANVQPGSIDLTLHEIIEVFQADKTIDALNLGKEELKKFMVEKNITGGYDLAPGDFVTGYSAEKIKLSSFLGGRIFNRNSLASIGIDAALSAFANPGFHGRKMIVIHNFGRQTIRISAGMRICQLELSYLSGEACRSFDERHNADLLENILGNSSYEKTKELIRQNKLAGGPKDTSLADFLNERIKAAAS